jgi:hypothetical protein
MIDSAEGAFERHDAMPAVATGAMCMPVLRAKYDHGRQSNQFHLQDNAAASVLPPSPDRPVCRGIILSDNVGGGRFFATP